MKICSSSPKKMKKMENPVSASLQAQAFSQPPATNPSRTLEPLMHKNRLQEYAQRSCNEFPIYQTVNEGPMHAPRFRSTVFIDGTSYTSLNTFSHRKTAEQDVAKLALDSIAKKIKDEGCPVILEGSVLCKSILNEFAVKMNMEMPTYNTLPSAGVLFVSSLIFNGVTYNGKAGRNKKEAEQLAAHAALLSLLDDSRYGAFLSEMIRSKAKMYNTALYKFKDSNISCLATTPTGANLLIHENKVAEAAAVADSVATTVVSQPSSGAKPPHSELFHKTKEVELETAAVTSTAVLLPCSGAKPPHSELFHKTKEVELETAAVTSTAVLLPYSGAKPPHNEMVQTTKEVETAAVPNSVPSTSFLHPSAGAKRPHHEFKIPKSEQHSECINLPITFVPSALQQTSSVGESSSRKRRRKKKRAKLNADTQWVVATIPSNKAAQCSTAL